MHRIRLVLLLCSCVLLPACGSSGGGSPVASPAGLSDPNALFTGTYGVTWIDGRADLPDVISCRWGTLTGDGAGLSVFEVDMNVDGALLALPPGDIGYAVQLDRTFEMGPVVPGTSVYRGAISENGDVVCFGSSMAPIPPSLAVGTRREGVHDLGSLNGSYFYISYSAFAGAGFNVAGWGSVDFDGAGVASFTVNHNFEGALAGPNPLAASYVVAADGQFMLTVGGGLEVGGSIGAGGEVLTAGGGVLAGQDPISYVFVRRGMGYADTDLDGSWRMAGFTHEFLANDYSSMQGGALKNEGDPDLAFVGLLNKNGSLEGMPFSIAPITIDAGGNVALELAPGVFLRGGMSADRRFMILGGTDQPGSDPTIAFFMR